MLSKWRILIVIISTINNDFSLPFMAIVCKKSYLVSLMGHKSWYWWNSYTRIFGALSIPVPIHTPSISVTFVSIPFHFKQTSDLEEVEMLGDHCLLRAWPASFLIEKTYQAEVSSEAEGMTWFNHIRTQTGSFSKWGGVINTTQYKAESLD